MNASAGDAQIRLDVNDAGELAEMLESLSQWLGSDPALQTSFGRWIGHPAYGIAQLRQDLDRFTFLLGGHDGEHWLTDAKPGDTQPGDRLTSPRQPTGQRGRGTPGLTRDPRGRPPAARRAERIKIRPAAGQGYGLPPPVKPGSGPAEELTFSTRQNPKLK